MCHSGDTEFKGAFKCGLECVLHFPANEGNNRWVVCSPIILQTNLKWLKCWYILKLQSVSFASLSPSLFENLELQLFAELSSLRGLCSGTAPARMNLMFWRVCVALSRRTGVDIYCTLQSHSSLRLGIYDPNKNFHRILPPSEQVTSLPRLFWPTEEKSINCANYYYCYTLFSNY